MSSSQYPLCVWCTDTTTCIRHKDKNATKEAKNKKAIAKVSCKEKARKSELKKMYPVFLALTENEMCGLKLKGCLGKATTVHHLKGRIGDQVFEVKDWMASCVWCNIQVENDPLAKEKGLKKSKFYE